MSYILVSVLALLAAAIGWLWWTATDLDKPVDFKQAVLHSKPNQFLLCPEGYCKDQPHKIAPAFQVPLTELQRVWDEMVRQQPGYQRLDKGDGENRRHYEKRTERLRFPDRITVEFVQLGDDSSSLAIYSRSKYGYADGGVNEKRVLGLLADLDARLKR